MGVRSGELLFVGDDWAEDHNDVELVDEQGRRLAKARLPEGVDGIARLHALVAEHLPEEWADLSAAEAASRVKVGIETDRGPWVGALVAAGYEVVKLLARTHQTLIWDRQRAMLRLRSTLREFFPAALEAFPNVSAPDALELLGRAPDPTRAAGSLSSFLCTRACLLTG